MSHQTFLDYRMCFQDPLPCSPWFASLWTLSPPECPIPIFFMNSSPFAHPHPQHRCSSKFQPWLSFLFISPLARVSLVSLCVCPRIASSFWSFLSLSHIPQANDSQTLIISQSTSLLLVPAPLTALVWALVSRFRVLSPSSSSLFPQLMLCSSKTKSVYGSLTAGNQSVKAIQLFSLM